MDAPLTDERRWRINLSVFLKFCCSEVPTGVATKVQRNYQIILPAAVRKQAQIKVGDLVGFEVRGDGILIKPLAMVDRSQLWFWSKRWQEEERKVEQDFRKGKVKVSKSAKEFLAQLNKA